MRVSLPPELRRVERARQRFAEDIGRLKAAAWGRYAPGFAFSDFFSDPADYRVDLRADGRERATFRAAVARALGKRFYQPETVRRYLGCLDSFLKWLTIPPRCVTRRVVGCFLMERRRAGASDASLRLYVSALRTIFDRLCGCSFTDDFYLPESPPADSAQLWTPAETAALFGGADSARDRLIIACLAVLKVTVTELLGLRAGDVAPDGSALTVWPGLGREEREVAVPERLRPLLLAVRGGKSPHDSLFPRPGAPLKPLTGRAVTAMLKRIARRCGLRTTVNCRLLRQCELPLPEAEGADVGEVRRTERREICSRGAFQAPAVPGPKAWSLPQAETPGSGVLLPGSATAAVARVEGMRTNGRGQREVVVTVCAGPGPPIELPGIGISSSASGDMQVVRSPADG